MEDPNYDSSTDTLLHIKRVNELLIQAAQELLNRAANHDTSKLHSPEKELFDKYTPLLKDSVFGSDEYAGFLSSLSVALNHHYANNSHHPQHYENGINGMTLFDVVEMFFDWKAAGERQTTGNIYKSIDFNKDRFEMSDQLAAIFQNTAKFLGYY